MEGREKLKVASLITVSIPVRIWIFLFCIMLFLEHLQAQSNLYYALKYNLQLCLQLNRQKGKLPLLFCFLWLGLLVSTASDAAHKGEKRGSIFGYSAFCPAFLQLSAWFDIWKKRHVSILRLSWLSKEQLWVVFLLACPVGRMESLHDADWIPNNRSSGTCLRAALTKESRHGKHNLALPSRSYQLTHSGFPATTGLFYAGLWTQTCKSIPFTLGLPVVWFYFSVPNWTNLNWQQNIIPILCML